MPPTGRKRVGTGSRSGVEGPALRGLRVLDLTQYEAGPSCTQLLAWLGADVVKVEPPEIGDPGRHIEGTKEDSDYFLSHNSNKRSIAINLQAKEGHELFLGLVRVFDVVVENFAIRTVEKLGLTYEHLRAVNPQIIYATIKGFGLTGPLKDYKAFDSIGQAAGGAIAATGWRSGPPVRSGATFGDTGSGLLAALCIVAAYVQQQRTGEGQVVEVSMQEAVASFMRTRLALPAIFPRSGNRSVVGATFNDLYPCAPGGPDDWVFIMVVSAEAWEALLKAMDRPDLGTDDRFHSPGQRARNIDELYSIISRWTSQRTKFEVMEHLGGMGVPCSAVYNREDLLSDAHLHARGKIVELDHPQRGKYTLLAPPIGLSGSDVPLRSAPLLGEHTRELLTHELGLSEQELTRLERDGIIRSYAPSASGSTPA